jgi:SAM-dependent methyltransferase
VADGVAMNVVTEQTHWNNRYGKGQSSGAGSYGKPMLRKVAWLSALEDVNSITEIGCGDFNFGKHLLAAMPKTTAYKGFDVSDFVIDRNKILYADPGRVDFYHMTADNVPTVPSDLVLCVDVLFHIHTEDNWIKMLEGLKRNWRKYLAISAYEYDGIRAWHVWIRKFDPAFFGTPILRKVIEDDGQLYFYIFER